MSGWLAGWGEPVPDPSMPGMDIGGMDMPRLGNAAGAEFDRLWLTRWFSTTEAR